MKRRARKAAGTLITFAYSVLDETGSGTMTYRLPWAETAPGVVAALKAGSIVDVRAIDIGVGEPLMPPTFEHERRWLICALALAEGDAVFTAMRDAQDALREDLYAGRILPGAHPGRPVVEDGPQAPLEVALQAFRKSTMTELEELEEKWQADRLKAARRRRRRWWWRAGAT